MGRIVTITCQGDICRQKIPKLKGQESLFDTINVLRVRLENHEQYPTISNGWEYVPNIGVCCPRCLKYHQDQDLEKQDLEKQ